MPVGGIQRKTRYLFYYSTTRPLEDLMLSGVIGLIGAITGAVAAVTGIAFGWWNAGREREARVALAQAGQEHERQITQESGYTQAEKLSMKRCSML